MDTASDQATPPGQSATVFRSLSDEVLQDLVASATTSAYSADERIFKEGKPSQDRVYIIRAGRIQLDARGSPLALLHEGDILGLESYVGGANYRSTATAITKVELGVLPLSELQDAEARHPELREALTELFTTRLREQAARRQSSTGVWAIPSRTVMNTPLAMVGVDTTLQQAASEMFRRGIGSIGVTDSHKKLLGMVTFKSLARALTEEGVGVQATLSDLVWETPRVVTPDAPMWRAHGLLGQFGIKYLVVCQDSKPLGMISQTDILDTLLSYQSSLRLEIAGAASFKELRAFKKKIGRIADEIRQQNRSAGMAMRALSEVHLTIQRRCIELVLEELEADGCGDPPTEFSFLILGSAGRKEMIVSGDQDNAIIMSDSVDSSDREWFSEFCDRVNHRLDKIGYEWCSGDIMARNPKFCRTLSEWRDRVRKVIKNPSEKSARWAAIFFDFKTLYGKDSLTVELRNFSLDQFRRKPRLLRAMVEDDAQGRPALGLFNRLVTASDKKRKGKVDLKRNGTRLVADVARIYALREGVSATNTGERLQALMRQGRLDAHLVESVLAAYDELLDITLGHQLRQLERGVSLDKLVDPDELTRIEHEALRTAMRVIRTFQSRLQGDFGTTML